MDATGSKKYRAAPSVANQKDETGNHGYRAATLLFILLAMFVPSLSARAEMRSNLIAFNNAGEWKKQQPTPQNRQKIVASASALFPSLGKARKGNLSAMLYRANRQRIIQPYFH
ncbi:hypothetical protein [Janthinobacterium lividum]|uniref:hypothetical protein n=1 Tax=Janthinobacterium lividum TaxID=29581 RepID=UPI001267CA80|nr:hypothetical protein [Janthinobacterium lividum]